jgi:hypothetical protein
MGGNLGSYCCVQADLAELGGDVSNFEKALNERLACICYQEFDEQHQQFSQQGVGKDAVTLASNPRLNVPFAAKEEASSGSHAPKMPPSRAVPAIALGQEAMRIGSGPGIAGAISTFSPSPGQISASSTFTFGQRDWRNPSALAGKPTPKEQEIRKAQLQEVVKAFVLRALTGVKCHVLDVQTEAMRQAVYMIESSLHKLLVQVDGHLHWSADLRSPLKVQLAVGNPGNESARNSDFLKAPALAALDRETRERLVVIEDHDGRSFFLLEQSSRRAEDFRLAVGILSMYGQDTRQAGNIRPQSQFVHSDVRAVAGDDDDTSPVDARQIHLTGSWPAKAEVFREERIEVVTQPLSGVFNVEKELEPDSRSTACADSPDSPLSESAKTHLAVKGILSPLYESAAKRTIDLQDTLNGKMGEESPTLPQVDTPVDATLEASEPVIKSSE